MLVRCLFFCQTHQVLAPVGGVTPGRLSILSKVKEVFSIPTAELYVRVSVELKEVLLKP